MNHEEETIRRVREAIKDRATWFYLLYKSFLKILPPDQVEKQTREAIYQFGILKGKRDIPGSGPQDWVAKHMAKGSGQVFESTILNEPDRSVQQMTLCPLVEAWKELGATAKEIDLLCDIAMEGDRGRADYHGISMEIPKRIGRGDSYCQLVLRKCKA